MAYERDPTLAAILAGRFREGPAYRVARPGGSTSWLLLATVEGRGTVGGVQVRAGEAALIAPGTPQAYRTAENAAAWEFLWAHFHPRVEWGTLLSVPEAAPGVRWTALGVETAPVQAALDLARLHGGRSGDPYEEWLAMGALESALVRIRRAVARSEGRSDARVRAAIAFAHRNLREPIGRDDLATAAGVSPSRLGALFRQETGVSPRAFVERIRLDRARQLLAMSEMSVRAVAAEVGFASEFYFSNRFRAAIGESPSAYRSTCRALAHGGTMEEITG